ncbi:uncharacterized protein LOC123273544 isoform X1 [Cotesia glomerata]|uniref:uncharacterized protein LOC123273544 isoform X1 n=1 Tax=Cotesia glomerata TaxID=32391 RepID=UPI001D010D54|nr:uncharacterized protein LOC123273544 isoform X1 [Cotesia glomerata]XP_044596903.1 uncharacterized protein LOC123273544 isoform X1 [Cotesia glomerata]XP_044596904.1 uncharacterized protein LOC123273544 isoform X1 [Cotesia glomerata]XP_044596905.1 uncharacterized protein LOC123273544 isoform X1 [Cotesia glomerata]XP_044596906.1 uncharacterized protein LOC123273544 isoform X1 [Cotesia glomerata]
MSGPDLREHSYVKVLYDFQYKTTEGREIAIKKNERLYLLQKTNADWWQVVRTWEQTSFYVPATYVREMSKSGGNQKKTSDEDKDVAFESLDGPKYKNMPKETSSAMKNVKKWLAGAMDSKQESPASSTTASSSSLSKSLYITDESHKHNAMDYQSRAELKVGLAAIKAKSLERDRERRSTYERQKSEQPVEITKFKKRPNETPKKLPNTMGIKDIDLDLLSSPSSSYKLTKSFSTSPKSFDAPAARIEIPLPDPFRQELKSSLDRRRKISDNADYDKLVQENRNHELNRQSRIRTKSSHSDDSQLESDNDERFLSRVDENPKRLDKPESKLSVSLREDSGTQSGRQSPSVSNRNSRSLDLDSKQSSLRTERSLSPKPNYGRQLTVAGQIADEGDSNNASSDCKILNDKRRTWAVEELMSELTQMCRERVNNKKPPNFQLKSTEIKGNFDPLDELTRELHEMNLQRSEGSTPQGETRGEFKSNDGSPSNVCKISINSTSGSRTHDLNSINTTVVIGRDDDELEDITEHSNISEASDLSDTSLAFRYPKVEKSTFTFRTGEVLPQSKPLKSPKSPKIDEYNEANILNDCSPDDKFDNRSLSLDKQSHYLKSATITTTTTANNDTSHSSPDNDHESSGYSNFKMRHTGKVKMRPKAKVKSDVGETQGELKLTPSLEKLASEIQFLPAKKATVVNHHTSNHNHNHSHSDSHSHNHNHNSNNKIYKNTSSLNESMSDGDAYDDSGIHDETYRSEDSGSGRRNIIYSNSFKTKREGRYFHRHEFTDDDDDDEDDDDNDDDDEDDDGIISAARKCNLKKSSTLHCATIPENYRRFRISNDFAAILARSKRRSRSLSDLNSFEDEEDIMEENVTYPQNSPKIKPVPLPRTKIPAIKSEDEFSTRLEDKREEMGTVAPLPRKITTKKDYPEVWVNSKQVSGYRGQTPEVDIESSTAVGFKSLLCTSDSGSDNCLQSKELVNNDSNERHDSYNYSSNFKNRGLEKSSSGANLRKDGAKVRESPSDEQILSSNASSEALQSQSESEFTGGLDASSQPSPVSTKVAPECYECAIDLPPGWTQKYDPHTDQICFINEQGDKWFSSNDDEGKIYFFEENSNESSWVLPTVTASKSQSNAPAHKEEKPMEEDSNATNEFSQPENPQAGAPYTNQNSSNNDAVSVSGSKKPGLSDWPQLSFDGNMIILKEGSISRTKITENGKKLRKNWSTSYAVLTELFLLFFKDSKTFNTMMKSGQSPIAKPDISVDLNGAIIEPGERASSRKNVYMISTVLGLQVLIQSDNTALAAEWFQEIHGAIRKLPFSFKSQAKPFAGPPEVRKISNSKLSTDQSEESKKSSKVARSRSMKTGFGDAVKRLDDSLEDLSGTVAERQTKIKAKLRRFFQRRPPVESLVKNGIYKNEPAFGSYLKDVCPTEHPRVPLFVKTCIEVLESNEENMKTDGLYRASGNLSQIQKIRLQVDQYNLSVLSQEEDVHVLTGALKLFFRELKEPLIPSSFFKEALNASMLKKTSAKIQCFRDIVKALPPANYDTLQFLLKHLLKVTSYQEFNRMHIPNLAIVFGPTLMWPAEESANMALDLMQQNLVIECLLSEYNKIFK